MIFKLVVLCHGELLKSLTSSLTYGSVVKPTDDVATDYFARTSRYLARLFFFFFLTFVSFSRLSALHDEKEVHARLVMLLLGKK